MLRLSAPIPAHAHVKNRLLTAMPSEDYELLHPFLEHVHLSGERSIYEQGDPIDYIYFPLDCIVSGIAVMNDGATVEIGMVGREAVVGIVSVLGEYTARNWTRVLVPGDALRMKSEVIRELFRQNDALQRLLMRSYRAIVTQISQRAVCNGRHTILHRLSCWLLMVHDRVGSDDIPLTQEVIAGRLGSRRASITQAAGMLQSMEAISYSRGKIHINDRAMIEREACECYEVLRREFNGLKISGRGQFPDPTISVSVLNREREMFSDL